MSDSELTIGTPGTGPPASSRGVSRRDTYDADMAAVIALVIVSGLAVLVRAVYDNWLAEADLITFFVPWFDFVGSKVGAGELPAWSRAYSGGAPIIGSPSTGWMYFPVMLFFQLASVTDAFKLLLLFQALLGAIPVYILARRLAMLPVGAFTAAAVFVTGPLLYEATRFTLVGSHVTTWIPLALLACDLGMSARRPLQAIAWGSVAGLALSQMIVIWPGQGALYGVMWIAAWLMFRSLFIDRRADRWARIRLVGRAFVVGLASALFAAGISAAAVLPILNVSEQSTIPGGDYSGVLGGQYASVPHQFKILLYYMFSGEFSIRAEGFGLAALTLAAFGLILARTKHGAAFFAIVLLVGLGLSVDRSPFAPVLNLVPGFEHFHGHRPIAIVWTLSLAPAMLCGAAVQAFADRRFRPLSYGVVIGVLATSMLLVAQVGTLGSWIGWPMFLGGMAVILVFASPSIPWITERRFDPSTLARIGTAALIGIVLVLPTGWDAIDTIIAPESPAREPGDADIAIKYLGKDDFTSETTARVLSNSEPGTAAEFLQEKYVAEGPFRYTSYRGAGYPDTRYQWVYNTFWWHRMQPNVVGLLVNARTLYLGLEQSSGYNPVQLGDYAQYIDTMNGARQDYHWLDTMAPALTGTDGQLLDMLNVRYLLVDISIPVQRNDHAAIRENFTEVFRDANVIVYENPDAFSRAWVVHQVESDPNDTGILLFRNNLASGSSQAFIDGTVPENLVATTAAEIEPTPNESATITANTDGLIRMNVTADHDGLVVISTTYTDGWTAWVNGRETPLYRTNTALMGVPVTQGSTVVELRYEPESLRTGLYISVGAIAIMGGLWLAAGLTADRRRNQPPIVHVPEGAA